MKSMLKVKCGVESKSLVYGFPCVTRIQVVGRHGRTSDDGSPRHIFLYSFNTLFLGIQKITVSESGSPFYLILLTVALLLFSYVVAIHF